MANSNAAFTGSIPENYDRYLGPLFFEPYARDLGDRLRGLDDGAAVLELACGTGIVTKELRERLPSGAKLVATDLNEAMMNYAKQKFDANSNVEWKQADMMELPFPDSSFDAAVCQFGIMFVPDKQKAFQEAQRVLKPGGELLFSVWDAMEHNPIARVTHQTIARFFETDPPNFYEIPFGFHDPEQIEGMLQTAGFAEIKHEVLKFPSGSRSAAEVSNGLVKGNPVIGAINERRPGDAETIQNAVADAVAKEFGDNPVKGDMQALVFSATKPNPAKV